MKILRTILLTAAIMAGTAYGALAALSINYDQELLNVPIDSSTQRLMIDNVFRSYNTSSNTYNLVAGDYGKEAKTQTKDGNGVYQDDPGSAITIPARPAAPSAIAIDYALEKLNGWSTSMQCTSGATSTIPDVFDQSWVACSEQNTAITPNTDYKYYYFRVAHTASSFRSLPISVVIKSRPATPNVSVDYVTETFKNATTAMEYKLNSGNFAPYTVGLAAVPSTDSQANVYTFRVAATATSFRSENQVLADMPERPEPPTISVSNYSTETISTTSAMEYREKSAADETSEQAQAKEFTATEGTLKITDWITVEGETPKTLWIRSKAASGKFMSEPLEYEVPQRPAAPGTDAEDPTQDPNNPAVFTTYGITIDYFDEKITGIDGDTFAGYQFAKTEDGSYSDPGTTLDIAKYKLYDTDIYIRKKAVTATTAERAFASAPRKLELAGRHDAPDAEGLLSKFVDFETEYLYLRDQSFRYDIYNKTAKKWYELIDNVPTGTDTTGKDGYVSLTALLNKGTSKQTLRVAGGVNGAGDSGNQPKFSSTSFTMSLSRPKAPNKKSYVAEYSDTDVIDAEVGQVGVLRPAEDLDSALTLEYALYNFSAKKLLAGESFESNRITSAGVAIGGETGLKQGQEYGLRYAARPSEEIFASAVFKLKLPVSKNAPKISWVPATEVYKGAKIGKVLYQYKDEGDANWSGWKVYSEESANELNPNDSNGKAKLVVFRGIGTDNKSAPTQQTTTIKVPARAATPTYSKDNGIFIDFDAEQVTGLSGMAYRVKQDDPDSKVKWKTVKSSVSKMPLKSFVSKTGDERVFSFRRVGTAAAANSEPLHITFKPRQEQATTSNIMYDYINGHYLAVDNLLISLNGKAWTALGAAATTTPAYKEKQIQYKLAPIVPATPTATDPGTPASAKATKFRFLKAAPFSGAVVYDRETGRFEGLSGLEFSRDGKTGWKSTSSLEGTKVADGKYHFRVPATRDEPASKKISVNAKYVGPSE